MGQLGRNIVKMYNSALFLIVVLSALVIASINTIRETECGKKCLPGFLLSWKWLPLACRSLEPYDKFCSCSCCGKPVSPISSGLPTDNMSHYKNHFKEEVEDEAEEVTEEDLEGGIKNEGFEIETTAEL